MSVQTRLCVLVCLLSLACIERPIAHVEPRTTSVVTKRFEQAAPTKLDLLLVVDNSASMADKQEVLAEALPDLVKTLVTAPCVRKDGSRQVRESAAEPCEEGAKPEFEPLSDIQVAVITSSLGGYGAPLDCVDDQDADMAHLLATRARAQDIPSDGGLLKWKRGQDPKPFIENFSRLVRAAGQEGCGWESGLEAWYRFLVDPAPYVALKRGPCFDGDTSKNCSRATTDAVGKRLIDQELLAQRKSFLRDDSLLVVAMLSDENDCSFQEHDHSWLLAQSTQSNGAQQPAPRGTAVCAGEPDDRCCQSCALEPRDGCPTEVNDRGKTVGLGCAANSGKYDVDAAPHFDHPNLRCFDQKRRFGIDLLYPEARYINALTQQKLCPSSTSLNAADCSPTQLIDNPLFPGRSGGTGRTSKTDVFLVGLVGAPWQDLAVDPSSDAPLKYRPAQPVEGVPGINWNWLVGDGNSPPQDALMIESVEPRTGMTPSLAVPLAAPAAAVLANPINGHEWGNDDRDDLQYACVFPLKAEKECATLAEVNAASTALPSCDCEEGKNGFVQSPLCQAADGAYGVTQFYAKAYPGTRQLRVLQGAGETSVVASICPKQQTDPSASDFGYRPAMHAIVDRLKGRLQGLCYDRSLHVNEDNTADCRIVEVVRQTNACTCGDARHEVSPALRRSASQQLTNEGWCDNAQQCDSYCACVIDQVPGKVGEFSSCQTDEDASGDGWCYIDEAQKVGAPEQVATCPLTARRRLRFVGKGVPAASSTTVIACAGDIFDE